MKKIKTTAVFFILVQFFTFDLRAKNFELGANQEELCLSAGDTLLLDATLRYRGPIKITNCDNFPGVIKIMSKQESKKAKIIGTEKSQVLKWEKIKDLKINGKVIHRLESKPIYRSGPFKFRVEQLYYKGREQVLARHPNKTSKWIGKENYFITHDLWDSSERPCRNGKTCIKGRSNEKPVKRLVRHGLTPGVHAVLKTSNWSFGKSELASVSDDGVSFVLKKSLKSPEIGHRTPQKGFGFFLQNHLAFLDAPGEWYFDEQEGYVYFWAPDGFVPESSKVLLARSLDEEQLLDINFNGAPIDLVMRNIQILRSSANGVRISNARNVKIKNIIVSNTLGNGVVINNLSGSLDVVHSAFKKTANNGFMAYKVAQKVRFLNNRFFHNGRPKHQKRWGMNFRGISVGGFDHFIARNNVFLNSGYAGISLGNVGKSVLVEQNKITGACFILNDCGAIYINGQKDTAVNDKKILRNIIHNTYGNTDGTVQNKKKMAAGIYLDHSASFYEIYENTLTNIRSQMGGIFNHGGNSNKIYENTVKSLIGPAFAAASDRASYNRHGHIKPMSENETFRNKFITADRKSHVRHLVERIRGDFQIFGSYWDNDLIHETNPERRLGRLK